MAKFAPGASFAVVAQKDGSFAVEVREPRRAVPLRMTGYASEAEATVAIASFTAIEPLPHSRDSVALAKLSGDIGTGQVGDAVQDMRDPAAVSMGRKGRKVRTSVLPKGRRAKIVRRVVSKRRQHK
jgi:hypothetical protein